MGRKWTSDDELRRLAEEEVKRIFANWDEFTDLEWIITVGMVRKLMREGIWKE